MRNCVARLLAGQSPFWSAQRHSRDIARSFTPFPRWRAWWQPYHRRVLVPWASEQRQKMLDRSARPSQRSRPGMHHFEQITAHAMKNTIQRRRKSIRDLNKLEWRSPSTNRWVKKNGLGPLTISMVSTLFLKPLREQLLIHLSVHYASIRQELHRVIILLQPGSKTHHWTSIWAFLPSCNQHHHSHRLPTSYNICIFDTFITSEAKRATIVHIDDQMCFGDVFHLILVKLSIIELLLHLIQMVNNLRFNMELFSGLYISIPVWQRITMLCFSWKCWI